MYPSEYAYHKDYVYRSERSSADCSGYPRGPNEDYVHCDGTPLRLADSDIGSEQYNARDYYVWPVGSRDSQLLFIFPTKVNMTTITLHYYSTSDTGLPQLRFYAVKDDFDVWDAPTSSDSHVEIAAIPAGGERGHRNISASFKIPIVTTKVLLVKFRSSFSFALSEVEFSICSSQQVNTSILKDLMKASDYLTTLPVKLKESTFGTIELESRKTSEF